MNEQWKPVSAFELGSAHLGQMTKVTFNDASIVVGQLLGVSQGLRETGPLHEHFTVATIKISGNDERFDLDEAKGISVLDDVASS